MWLFYNLVIHFLFDEHLSCFQFFAVRNNVAICLIANAPKCKDASFPDGYMDIYFTK